MYNENNGKKMLTSKLYDERHWKEREKGGFKKLKHKRNQQLLLWH